MSSLSTFDFSGWLIFAVTATREKCSRKDYDVARWLYLRLNLAFAKVCPKIKIFVCKVCWFSNESSTWRLLVHIKQLFKPILGNYRKCMVVHFAYFYKQPGRCLKTEDWGFLERVTHDFFFIFDTMNTGKNPLQERAH